MPDDLDDLARLRAAIDRIDDTVVDLLVERMGHVQAIAVAKGVGDGRLAIRPAREAAILRRLVARSDGMIPAGAVVRIWREVIGAATARQTPFTVVVAAPNAHADLAELARGHFGTTTPLIQVEKGLEALALLESGEAAVAVVGLLDPGDPWWTRIPAASWPDCSVFGCVPFAASGGSETAWLFGPVTPEPTGDDASLIRIAPGSDLDARRLLERLSDAGLAARHLQAWESAHGDVHLLEVDGFLAGDAAGLADHLGALCHELLQCTVLGAYPHGIAATDDRPAFGDSMQPRRGYR